MRRNGDTARRDDRGTAAVEFALVLSLVSLMLIGVADFGLAFYRSIQISDAVNYATTYKLNNPGAALADVEQKATDALAGLDALTVTASLTCSCDHAAQTCSAANEAACGGVWREFIVVNASASVDPILSWPGIPDPIPISAESTKVVP